MKYRFSILWVLLVCATTAQAVTADKQLDDYSSNALLGVSWVPSGAGSALTTAVDTIQFIEGNSSVRVDYTFNGIPGGYASILRSYGTNTLDLSFNPSGLSIQLRGQAGNIDNWRLMLYEDNNRNGNPFDVGDEIWTSVSRSVPPGAWNNFQLGFAEFTLFSGTGDATLNLDRIIAWRLVIDNGNGFGHSGQVWVDDLRQDTTYVAPVTGTDLLDGTFIQIWNTGSGVGCECGQWTPAQWQAELQKIKDSCQTRIFIQYAVYEPAGNPSQTTSWYFSSIPQVEATNTTLPVIMALAETLGLQVVVGLYFNDDWGAADKTSAALYSNLETWQNLVIPEIAAAVGSSPAFSGWYIPQEFNDLEFPVGSGQSILLGNYLQNVAAACTAAVDKPVYSAPYFGGNMPADQWQQLLVDLWVAAPALDILLVQDGVGTHRTDADVDVPHYFAASQAAAAISGKGFGAVVESFDVVNPLPFVAVPANINTFKSQMWEAGLKTALLVQFEYPYMMSSRGPAYDQLWQDYKIYQVPIADCALPTATFTVSPTLTPTPTPYAGSPTNSPTDSPSPSATPTPTESASATISATNSPTRTATMTATVIVPGAIIINEVYYDSGINPQRIEFKNIGAELVNMSGWCLRSGFNDLCISTLIMPPGSIAIMDWTPTVLNDFGEMALFISNGYTNPLAVHDYLQWGSAGHTNEAVASAAGVWAIGDFVDSSTVVANTSLQIQEPIADVSGDWCVRPQTQGLPNWGCLPSPTRTVTPTNTPVYTPTSTPTSTPMPGPYNILFYYNSADGIGAQMLKASTLLTSQGHSVTNVDVAGAYQCPVENWASYDQVWDARHRNITGACVPVPDATQPEQFGLCWRAKANSYLDNCGKLMVFGENYGFQARMEGIIKFMRDDLQALNPLFTDCASGNGNDASAGNLTIGPHLLPGTVGTNYFVDFSGGMPASLVNGTPFAYLSGTWAVQNVSRALMAGWDGSQMAGLPSTPSCRGKLFSAWDMSMFITANYESNATARADTDDVFGAVAAWLGNAPCTCFSPTVTETFTPSPSPSPTASPTSSETPAGSPSDTPSSTSTATISSTFTFSPTVTGTPSATVTATVSDTSTATRTASPSPTATSSVTITSSSTVTPSVTESATPSASHTSSQTPTLSATLSSSVTASPSATETPVLSPTDTLSPTASSTSTGTSTMSATVTSTFSNTPVNTATATPSITQTRTPSATVTLTDTATVTMSYTPSFTLTYTTVAAATSTMTPTFTMTRTSTPNFTATMVEGTGPNEIDLAQAAPNPANPDGPVAFYLELTGPSDEINLEIFTPAYNKVFSHWVLGGVKGRNTLTLPAGSLAHFANGLFYFRVITLKQGRLSEPVTGKIYLLR